MYRRSSIDDPDPGARKRDVVSLVLAIVLVTLVLGVVHWQPADDREAAPLRVVLEREAAPAPTPPPTPRPTPLPPLVHVTPAPIAQRAAPRRLAVSGGGRPVPTVQPTAAPTAFVATSAPEPVPAGVAAGAPALGSGTGAGTGSGSASGAGTGTGNGTGGTGAGQVNTDTPCGLVEFEPNDAVRTDRGTMYEQIRAIVHFRDGHSESADFPYAWVYPNGEQTDPWSDTNTRLHPDAPVRAQFPPARFDARRLPTLIRYILDHTSPLGTTILEECPTLRP